MPARPNGRTAAKRREEPGPAQSLRGVDAGRPIHSLELPTRPTGVLPSRYPAACRGAGLFRARFFVAPGDSRSASRPPGAGKANDGRQEGSGRCSI